MNRPTLALPAILTFCAMLLASSLFAQSQPKTRNVVVIVADGLRWQEVFTGADPSLLNSENGGIWGNPERLKREFWRDDSKLPLVWLPMDLALGGSDAPEKGKERLAAVP